MDSSHSERFLRFQQQALIGYVKALSHNLRSIESALVHGATWEYGHAAEWRDAQRVADRIKEKYGDLGETSE